MELGASSRDLRLSAEQQLAGDEPVVPATVDTTPQEIAARPGGEALLEEFLAGSAMFEDPDMRTMAEQIPIGRFTGIGGYEAAEIRAFLDRVNAAS